MSSSQGTTTWYPAEIFSPSPKSHRDFALIILNQPLSLRASLYSTVWANSVSKVAADGGANRIYDLNTSQKDGPDLLLDLIIGDLDSLLPHVREYWESRGVEIAQDPDQNSTDFGKAFTRVRDGKEGEKLDIVVLGGLGGRVDQGMSTLHHLYMFQSEAGYAAGKMLLLSGDEGAVTFLLKSGRHRIRAQDGGVHVKLGRHVGVIPLKEASVITTKGLEWDVEGWKTEFGGQMSTSNHVREEWVEVETSKDVLFTIDLEMVDGSTQ